MIQVRRPAVAGTFYPDSREELTSTVDQLLKTAPGGRMKPKAMIVPHAGYVYSGAVAASGYAFLENVRDSISRVVLIGPSHWDRFKGLAVSSARVFSTPLGPIPIDQEANRSILELPQVQTRDLAHHQEHSLEVQLPFLQRSLEKFELVPITIGSVLPEEVTEVLIRLWNGSETLLVVSSDLSHYFDYETAVQLDRRTSAAIEGLQADELNEDSACGRIGIAGLLMAAKKFKHEVRTVNLGNSGDYGGEHSQVVGYGCYLFIRGRRAA